jgi:hypothetical protein
MKRKLLLVITLLALTTATFAQKPSAESIKKRLSLGFGVFNDFWLNVPDSINPRGIHQGIDAFIHYSFPMDKKGHLSFFIGGGIGAHNFYNQALIGVGKYNVYEKPLINDPKRQNVSYLYNAPRKIDGSPIEVIKSKLSITYVDVPFGLQYKSRKKVHGTLGFKVGWSVNAHTKYKGTSLDGSGLEVIEKSLKLSNIENFHYGPYAVIGYKWIGASVFYQISSVFEKDLGPQIHPISLGLVFKPY